MQILWFVDPTEALTVLLNQPSKIVKDKMAATVFLITSLSAIILFLA